MSHFGVFRFTTRIPLHTFKPYYCIIICKYEASYHQVCWLCDVHVVQANLGMIFHKNKLESYSFY